MFRTTVFRKEKITTSYMLIFFLILIYFSSFNYPKSSSDFKDFPFMVLYLFIWIRYNPSRCWSKKYPICIVLKPLSRLGARHKEKGQETIDEDADWVEEDKYTFDTHSEGNQTSCVTYHSLTFNVFIKWVMFCFTLYSSTTYLRNGWQWMNSYT